MVWRWHLRPQTEQQKTLTKMGVWLHLKSMILLWHDSLLSYKTIRTAFWKCWLLQCDLNKNKRFLFFLLSDTVNCVTQKEPQTTSSSLSASNFLELIKHKSRSIPKEMKASLTIHLELLTRVEPCVTPKASLLQSSTISFDEIAKQYKLCVIACKHSPQITR